MYCMLHGLQTPNEGINQRNLEKLGRCGRQNMLWPYLKLWEWELIFSRALKAISSLGVRSPCMYVAEKALLKFYIDLVNLIAFSFSKLSVITVNCLEDLRQ